MPRHPANLAAVIGAAFAVLVFAQAPARARPVQTPPNPVVRALQPESAQLARLTWDAVPGSAFRVCVTWDRARAQPYACFGAGSETSTVLGIPQEDNQQFLLSLQACSMAGDDCSQPVNAGIIGRRRTGAFDFYATALMGEDGRAHLGGFSLQPGSIWYAQAAAGSGADQRITGCAGLGTEACGVDALALPGALASVSQEVAGAGTTGITFELRERPHAALLFDDGTGLFTGSRLTAQVVLDEFGVKGNFFLMGRIMRDYPAAIRALVAAGHRVGNHTYTHPFLSRMTDAQIAAELDQTEAQYRAIIPGGTTKPCFRAPNGDINGRVNAMVQNRGYRQINWDVGSLDWTRIPADQVARNVLRDLHDGALISFHTQEPATMIALRTLIPLLQSWGYVFDLVC